MPHSPDRNLIQFLLTIAFVVVVAIFNWIKKHNQSDESPDSGTERKIPQPPPPVLRPRRNAPPTVEARPVARRINWEEQLRRALEGPQTEPPISPRRPTQEPRTSSERPFLAPTTPSYIPQSLPRQPRVAEQDQGFPVELPGLTTSIQSYERASQLDENVGQRLRMVGKQIELHPVRLQGKIISQQVEEARALLRTPTSLRTLIMASVILGPPKGLGN